MNRTDESTAAGAPALDYRSETYRDAYSRINAIVLEGEREACANYLALAELLPDHADALKKLSAMENRHFKGFQSCARNLEVTPDDEFARRYFAGLDANFQRAAASGDIAACMVIQALIIECFAIAAYNIYIPVADPFARRVTEGVVKDEYTHLNFGQQWLKDHFEAVRPGIEQANAQNLPIVWRMLGEVEDDAATLQMDKEAIVEDFLIQYGEALSDIGFTTRDVMKMSARGLAAAPRA
ncbi:aldehyde oxygenase (deformylating) [Gloeobacter kilaueensis]|uniref:Aldehyde decarbonylase n=1 Tax=Gloeobacter kilaueensis (strain ATCC BAA-2537 / CCAP 1431/1 / ULC 316 / JS1) TaxID=1183438 RepID=U5QDK0_GLOK1|nr:aldehyde oxygenase (deformylating) [Gloeobacter kilaueensis]AGY56971.1 fatty aldehyde decarbonylase [Gloeobacter kilaueensis JS1]